VLLAIAFMSGARWRIVYLIVTYATWFILNRGWQVRVYHALIAVPTLGLVSTLLKYVFRVAVHSIPFTTYVASVGGIVGLFFDPTEFVMPSLLTALVGFDYASEFVRQPWETVSLLVLYPLPRALFPWKPTFPSDDVTRYFAPDVVEDTGSRTTIGLFGDAYIEYGLLGGIFAIACFGFLYGLAAQWCARQSRVVIIRALPLILYCAYQVYRTGLATAGQMLWPFGFYVLVIGMLTFISAGASAATPERNRHPGTPGPDVAPRPFERRSEAARASRPIAARWTGAKAGARSDAVGRS
jgi:hypothetical protein